MSSAASRFDSCLSRRHGLSAPERLRANSWSSPNVSTNLTPLSDAEAEGKGVTARRDGHTYQLDTLLSLGILAVGRVYRGKGGAPKPIWAAVAKGRCQTRKDGHGGEDEANAVLILSAGS